MGTILVVDDNPESRKELCALLVDAGYDVAEAENEEFALQNIKKATPDIVLVDMKKPDLTDFEVCQRLRNTPRHHLIYLIIILTDASKMTSEVDRVADDYVTKPFEEQDLLKCIKVGLHAVEKKRSSMKDGLQGLYDRNFFNRYFVQEVERVHRYNRHLSLMLIDVDAFHAINIEYGHVMGDVILSEISKIIRQHCRETDIPVQWGGEEFAILLPETELEGAVYLADRIRQAIDAHPFEDGPHVTASFGVANFQSDEQDLLMRADAALHKAKHQGRNSVVSSK